MKREVVNLVGQQKLLCFFYTYALAVGGFHCNIQNM